MRRRALSSVQHKSLPLGCVALDYIESTGTQYIDTGIVLTSNHSVEIDYQLTEVVQNRKGLFGGLFDGSLRFGMLLSPSNNYLEFGYGGNNTYWQYGLPDTNRHLMKQEQNKVYLDGELLYTFKETTFTTNKTAPLGNFSYTNYNPALARYYSSKIWDGDKLVRDFIPIFDADGVACWYDNVTEEFYYNKGTGAFIAGQSAITLPIGCKRLEYIESTGTQYINTELLSTSQSIVDIEFGFTSMGSGAAENAAIFGGRNAQTSLTFTLFKLASATPQYFRFDFNTQVQVATSAQMRWDAESKYRFVYNGTQTKTTNVDTGQEVVKLVNPSNLYTTNPICLFAVNTNGVLSTHMRGRIYHFAYSDGENSIDLVPVLDAKGVACMFDMINGKFYYNQGTESFLYK